MKLAKPHDTLFKNAFADPQAALALVEPSLPRALVALIEEVELTAGATELQGPEGATSFCDLVFEFKIKSQEQYPALLVHLNLEHQSKVEQGMIYRCLAYAGNLLHRFMLDRADKSLAPAVLSVVVSNAEERWDAPTNLAQTYALRGELADQLTPMLTQHSYAVIDLFELSDKERKDRAWAAWQRLALLLLRKGREEEVVAVLTANRPLVEEVSKMPEGQARLNLSLWYVSAVNKHESVNPKAVNAALASAGSESSRHARANWEAYEAGLRAEGRAEGEEKGQADMLIAMLEIRFGEVTEAQRARVLAAGSDQLKAWLPRALQADSVEAALGEG